MSNNYPKFGWAAAVILFSAVLTGCEIMLPQQQEVQEEVLLKKYEGIPLAKVLTNTQNRFKEAKEANLFFFSPNNYRAARTGLQAARAYFKDPERKTYVLKKIYQTEQAIDDGFEVKKIILREVPEFPELYKALIALGAKKTHAQEFRGRRTNMFQLIERIEAEKEAIFTDKDKKARFEEDKKEVIAELRDFRLRLVKYKYLNHGELLIAEAESNNARDIAPVTYKAAVDERQKAITYIENNVENPEGIQKVSERFEFAAQRLMHITREVFNVLNLQPNTHEEYVLRQEERLTKIANAQKAGDLRDQSFRKQATELAGVARRIIKQKEDLALQIAELRSASGSGVAVSAGEQSTGEAQEDNAKIAEITEQQSAAALRGQNTVIPVIEEGNPEEMQKSIRLLTDQVYQLIIENDKLKGQNKKLKGELAKLGKKSEAAKPKTTTKDSKKQKPANDKPPKQQSSAAKKEKTKQSEAANEDAKNNNDDGNNKSPAADDSSSGNKTSDSETAKDSEGGSTESQSAAADKDNQ